ncbi:hypothetical protein QL285_064544 [Trifolium repens]|nr:hypothetical protein QL285_064544 [Trifolium repens]
MVGETPNHGTHGSGMTLTEAVSELRRLQAQIPTLSQEKANKESDQDEDQINDSQPLAQDLWDARVPENFKTPHLPKFDGKTDPTEHLMAVGTQTAIIGAAEHLKCKLLSGTLKEAALFTTRQNYAETLREYLARFCEATIKVSNPNQEMFVAAFHNGLKADHFNESLAQKPATSMQEIIKRAECYIKGEESNSEKRSRDARKREPLNKNNKAPDACKGHDTEKCFRLRDLIEELIKSGHLRKFLDDAANGKIVVPKVRRDPQRDQERNPEGEKVRIAVNTIAGGFAGGGESSNARKRYVRRSEFEAKFVGCRTHIHFIHPRPVFHQGR